ncbi:zinc-ribbon and DUF3426 domain-containing protein [Marinomonas atlantica]|uniref:zinc-ribbon and DUF3426 domain-containing protein n=1 Tax=Marinomonas atlantica TaxID=1806668 RepID=UPI000836B0D8|nr:zinc-ribbon and DUF3426 domain-containing protein [Marinomonas atlantica]MCO4786176.1 zinc-ribbon domain-containing protein [Marinomonas atlantica]
MSESMITRCPKCSTTFRVTQEVLSMAKGKVRCGQCFHIFTAAPAQGSAPAPDKVAVTKPAPKPTPASATTPKVTEPTTNTPEQQPTEPSKQKTAKPSRPIQQVKEKASKPETVSNDGSVNPDWLNTLFDEDDLTPYSPPKGTDERFVESMEEDDLFGDLDAPKTKPTPAASKPKQPKSSPTQPARKEELAPWEVELAELESQMSAQSPASAPVFSEQLQAKREVQTSKKTPPPANNMNQAPEADEPDYMHALHSLAQDVSKHDTLSDSEYSSQESMKQLAAEYSLATLTDTEQPKKHRKKAKFTWLWTLGTLAALALLAVQVGVGYFEQGSRSAQFRGFYKAACAYVGCTLPTYEDVAAVDIEHVRIQSHPTLNNSLQVNAIMTNSSRFAQPMPKLALEFYDLNGRPVAARLFSPKDYLHKDFLDITFMPPSTPVHIVIPIQDPGARAVTHQIKVFSNKTQSY